MRLYESEGKELLRAAGLESPLPLQLSPLAQLRYQEPCVLKAQVLYGKRWDKGLIQPCLEETYFPSAIQNLMKAFQENNLSAETTKVLVEPLLKFGQEMYLALRYDTRTRLPVLYFDPKGGTGIEDRASSSSLEIFPLTDLTDTIPTIHADLHPDWVRSFINTFFNNDLTLLEINPLVLVNGRPLILDAKVELEDTAAFRHPQWQEYQSRTLFPRDPSENELKAKAVNAMDHRGAAGASYFDFPGTIGILASGGGASLLAMDALLASGLKPANYTEYSGNPTREKVHALSEVVLSQPNLEGLWVVGGHANFTDIYETLMGVMDALESAQLPAGFPVVIRRGGPRTEEAYSALIERCQPLGLNLQFFDSQFPITDTVAVLVKAVEQFRKARK